MAESFEPGTTIAAVACKNGVSLGLLHYWRRVGRKSGQVEVLRFVPVTIPGIVPITATAIAALAPSAETFTKGRDFAAWLGLTPLQKSIDRGQAEAWRHLKRGERTLRRLLIIGSSAVVL